MEIRAYNEAYLDNAMVTMATMLDYAVNEKHEHIDYFFQCFLYSPYAQQFERGNPAFPAQREIVSPLARRPDRADVVRHVLRLLEIRNAL